MALLPPVHIIDDDEAVRDSLAVLLEIRGLDVLTYASASDFLETAQDGVTGCVVTDVQMPEMNGLELLRAFKARGLRVPVLVITARSGRALADEALALGARAVIEKPFEAEAFVEAVQQALAAAP